MLTSPSTHVPIEPGSLSDRAYARLRTGLVSCTLPPGSRLNIVRLQQEYGVSQAALREALSRLVPEGLVVASHNSGFRAAPILAGGYRQLADACNVIEVPCLRAAIRLGDKIWEQGLLESYAVAGIALARAAAGDDGIEPYARGREGFHRALFSACGNDWLLSAWSLLYTQHMRYRQFFPALARFESSLFDDYTAFVTAIRARHEEEAVRIWTDNHRKVSDFFERSMEEI